MAVWSLLEAVFSLLNDIAHYASFAEMLILINMLFRLYFRLGSACRKMKSEVL
jgi:hypothetical protein